MAVKRGAGVQGPAIRAIDPWVPGDLGRRRTRAVAQRPRPCPAGCHLVRPVVQEAADGMTTRAIPFEKSFSAVEGGYVRGSSSGRQKGEIDTQ
jgi:hypothetical protein